MFFAILDFILEAIAVIVGGALLVCFLAILAFGFVLHDVYRLVCHRLFQTYYHVRYKLYD
jgi:hypothetical protein